MPQRQTKKDKEHFFAGLDQLDDSTTESEDEIEVLIRWNQRRKATSLPTDHHGAEKILLQHGSSNISREGSFEAPIIIYDTPNAQHEGHSTSIEQPPSPTPRTAILSRAGQHKRPVADHPIAKAPVPKRSKKIKDTIEVVAEKERIFAGFSFCM